MGRAKNTNNEFAKKCLLFVVGLALFASPLSHKFYLIASPHSFRVGDPGQIVGHSDFSVTGLADYEQCHLYSIDKRYDYKHSLGLLTPSLAIVAPTFYANTEYVVPQDATPFRAVSTAFLRGPPSRPVDFSL